MKNNLFKVCIIALILIAICIRSFGIYISSTDEMWNFMNIIKITNNFSDLYSGANIIVTPLFFIISTVLFKIFSANIIVFRIFNVVIKFSMFVLIYNIMKRLISNKKISYIASALYMLLLLKMDNGANYNELAMLFALLGLFLNIIKDKGNYKFGILQGTVIYLIFMSKQNIAVYYIIANVLMYFILLKDKKKAFFRIAIELLTFLVITVVTFAIFAKIGIFDGFINYCFLGMGNFTNNFSIAFSFLEIIKYCIIIISSIVFMILYFKKYNEKSKKNKEEIITVFIMGICMLGYIFPIVNGYHLTYGLLIYYIFIVSIICNIFEELISETVTWYITALFVILCVLYTTFLTISIIKNRKDFYTGDKMPELKYSYISNEVIDEISKLNEYMDRAEAEGKNIKMFNYRAFYRYIYSKKANGFYDLPFLGNFGALDERGVLKKIIDDKGTYIILLTEDKMFGQESKTVNTYIRENFEKIDEFLDYEVYYID